MASWRLTRKDRHKMLKLRYDIFGADALGNAKFIGKYEFPFTPGSRISKLPDRIVPFDRIGELRKGDWLHSYVHDRRFCNFLARRLNYAAALGAAGGFIGFDNSMYRDLPLAEQIHSCYLNRAIDHYLYSFGKPVIANVSWGDYRSYEFCCDGIAEHSTVAMSTYGCCRNRQDRAYFEDGFVYSVERLHPCAVVIHGPIWSELSELIAYHDVQIIKISTQREMVSRKEVRHG